jgi:anti-sigma regulatory factor (Ser/Thr protein kinase)
MTRRASGSFAGVDAPDVEVRLAFELAGTPEASATARRLLLAGNGALPGSVRDEVLLLVTELVSNVVRHADAGPDSTLRVELRHSSRMVRVAVYDEGPGFATQAADRRRDDHGGWGLLLVDRIADRWAITPTATGTCVSFELRYGESQQIPCNGSARGVGSGAQGCSAAPDEPLAPDPRVNSSL